MSQRMSCSITTDQVIARTKTVTRRHINTWRMLKVGDRLTLVEKGMGLKTGEHQNVLADVEIVSVTVEPLAAITAEECTREGFPTMSPEGFIRMWVDAHWYQVRHQLDVGAPAGDLNVRRIEWRYLDE